MLNKSQKSAVDYDGNVCLVSCPGSGKTRTIVSKILVCLDEVRGTPRKVGCITYTNTGVYEVESRLKSYGTSEEENNYEICTIHAFCLNNILRPYHHLLDKFSTSFDVATPDNELFQKTVTDVSNDCSLERWTADLFSSIQRESDGEIHTPDGISPEAAEIFLDTINDSGYVTLGDIVYYAYKLLDQNQFIARGLSSKLAWLLIDEFQDTSSSQVEILKIIYNQGRTKFFLVGDTNQSILGFAGAHPEKMAETAEYIHARTDIKLLGNYRCSSRIVICAEKLCPNSPPMEAVGETKEFDLEPQYVHARTMLEGITDYFLPAVEELGIPLGEVAILSPWWIPLMHLGRRLRERELPIIGPGARPYKRSLEFAQFAEQACSYIIKRDAESASGVQKALYIMLLNITGSPNWNVYSYQGKITLYKLLKLAKSHHHTDEAAIDWLILVSQGVADILIEDEYLPSEYRNVIIDSAQTMVSSIRQHIDDANNLSVDYLGLFARPRDCIHLLTMHRAKGKEFDAVAVVDMHEGKVPHFKATQFEETKRLLYVATTRARKLIMYITDSFDARNRPSRYLGPHGINILP